MIRLAGVTKLYAGGQAAVRELSIEFPTGQLTMLVGPSGCGKTTTLKMINRLIEPTGGRIFLDDQDVTHIDPVALRLRMGYVIQNVGLFPHLTIADNVGTTRASIVGDIRTSSRGVSASVSEWPAPWESIRPSSGWTNRLAPSIASPASGCRRSFCGSRAR
jgi:osmoprotectant transport system ATP-binding protein